MDDAPATDVTRQQQREIAQLRLALASRAVIEQAKGILMARYAIGADAAFRLLIRWSQNGNVKLRVLAEAVVATVCDRRPSPDLDPALVGTVRSRLRVEDPRAAELGSRDRAG